MVPTHLCAVVVEDAHQGDGHGLVDTAAQGLPGEGEHKGNALLSTRVDDVVESFIQTACGKECTSILKISPQVK